MEELIKLFIKFWPVILSFVIFWGVIWKNQRLILAKLETFTDKFQEQDEDIKNLYRHKDSELKYRAEAESKFLTQKTHQELSHNFIDKRLP